MRRIWLTVSLCLAWCLMGQAGCDADGDGWVACDPARVAGIETQDCDCEDLDDTIYPGAPELCDGLDNDCNGEAENSCWGEAIWGVSLW